MSVVSPPPSFSGHPYQTPIVWSQGLSTPTSAGTTRHYLGVAEEAGLTVRRFRGVATTAITLNTSNYYTFKPFVSTFKDGTATIRYLGTRRATNALSLLAGHPVRLHDEEQLNERIPQGATIGVEIVTTGTPSAVQLSLMVALTNER